MKNWTQQTSNTTFISTITFSALQWQQTQAL